MTPEAFQDFQAYFNLFDEEEDDKNDMSKEITESELRSIVREEAKKVTESIRVDSSEFIDELAMAIGDNHMGYTVERSRMDTIRFFATANGQRIHVHATPYFNGETGDMTVSVAINDEPVREGMMAFYGESMYEEIMAGNLDQAAAMYKDAINPVLEAGYGLAEIRT